MIDAHTFFTVLHYACAYGFYFCVKLLVDAGCELNPHNDWNMTPISISLLKGHQGLAKYLLNHDMSLVNSKNDKGRTVIMTILIETLENDSPLTEDLFSEITELVENCNADASIQDKFKRNILHYLSAWDISLHSSYSFFDPNPTNDDSKSLKMRFKMLIKFVKYFLKHGCDPWQIDEDGDIPLSLAFQTKCSLYARNYPLIELLLNSMMDQLKQLQVPLVFDHNKDTFLTSYAKNVSFLFIDKEKDVFDQLSTMIQTMGQKGLIATEKFVEARKGPFTSFIELCARYTGFPTLEDDVWKQMKVYDFLGKPSTINRKPDSDYETARLIIQMFLDKLKPKVFYQAIIESVTKEGKKKVTIDVSAALAILGAENSNETVVDKTKSKFSRAGFEMMLRYTKEVDCKDHHGLTQLFKAVQRGHIKQASNLIAANANVNFVHETSKETEVTLLGGKKFKFRPLHFPLIDAIAMGNLEIVKALLNSGALFKPENSETKLTDGTVFFKQPLFTAIER